MIEFQYNEDNDWLNDVQYAALLKLYNECPEAWHSLAEYWKTAFYARLYSKDQTKGNTK